MHVTIPDSLKAFIDQQVAQGRYANSDAFVTDLVRQEAEAAEALSRGEALPPDQHFSRRVESLLHEAENSGGYLPVNSEDFDALEREALEIIQRRRRSD